MEEIKTAFEIAMEKAAEIGEPTKEEREKIKAQERLNSILARFNKEEIDANELWKLLKEEGKEEIFKEAQKRLIESLRLKDSLHETQRKREGILAIETLKEDKKIPEVEALLNTLQEIQKRYDEEMKMAYNNFRIQVERNPELRIREIQQQDTKIVVQLSVEDAIEQLPEWRYFLSELNTRYESKFQEILNRLLEVIK
ncbi:MAG: hypothetical protein KatS3mg078_0491 [Deltaproteobacteria bacterium]|jgi:2-hydroxy-3-keto-5-methylthiopentenyl-1-phosphate phosphatase|nr:MAG: hypothetical protein KatS3mg078_0491 [Deltaproteobacteria bacterium]